MASHLFLLTPGVWIGQGRVVFEPSGEKMHFYTHWESQEEKEGVLICRQKVEIPSEGEGVENLFYLSQISANGFAILLENEMIGQARGIGIIEPTRVGWQFRIESGLEGFEVYQLQESGPGDYRLHAEYLSLDQCRTVIDGLIWRKDIS